jgi:CRISPR/Cas system-associated endoribonuclease Cas2
MAVFIISYDPRKPDDDCGPLYDALDDMGAKRIQQSVWGVRTNSTADEIFDVLWERLPNENDHLFVIPFDKDGDYRNHSIIKLKDL